jgi:3alpha(or 20beta)-hydroxysteroid dehydrogenase
MTRLDGKVAIVTGAARGQGRAISRRLAEAGARIIAGDVLTAELASLTDELGEGVVTGHLDVRDRGSWDALIERGLDTFGRIDILVNNAGILRTVPLEDETAEAFEDVWRVNCLGPFHGIQAVVPHLRRAGGGAIVNTLSTAAVTVWTRHGSYAASKWAHRGLTKVAALELAPYAIRVNAVLPGPIDTPMVLPVDDPATRQRLSRTPLGRIGEPDDIAAAVLFLVSDEASFMTGAEVAVDGGQTTDTVL